MAIRLGYYGSGFLSSEKRKEGQKLAAWRGAKLLKPRQWRQSLAHGASRGPRAEPLPSAPSPAGPPADSSGPLVPGLAPWATIFRPFRGYCDLDHLE